MSQSDASEALKALIFSLSEIQTAIQNGAPGYEPLIETGRNTITDESACCQCGAILVKREDNPEKEHRTWFLVPGSEYADQFCTNSPNSLQATAYLVAIATHRIRWTMLHSPKKSEPGKGKVVGKACGFPEALLTALNVKYRYELKHLGIYRDKVVDRDQKEFGKLMRSFTYNTPVNMALSLVATIYAISRISLVHADQHTDLMSAQAAFLFVAEDHHATRLNSCHLLPQVDLLNEFLAQQGVEGLIDMTLHMHASDLDKWDGDEYNQKGEVISDSAASDFVIRETKSLKYRESKMRYRREGVRFLFVEPEHTPRYKQLLRIVHRHAEYERQIRAGMFSKKVIDQPKHCVDYATRFLRDLRRDDPTVEIPGETQVVEQPPAKRQRIDG